MKAHPRPPNETIVTQWLFIRYMVIGTYVGLATAYGFVWWFLEFEGGPRMTWSELTDFQHCVEGKHRFPCSTYTSTEPSTVAMTVLVVIEMFNALNALSGT